MHDIAVSWILVGVGILGLVWSADRFVAGAAALASNLGVSQMVIGLTIVSLGTSAPEILVSIHASLDGHGELAIGNALGSNIANIGLVLAVTALVATIPLQRHILTQELPALLFITAITGHFLHDAIFTVLEGILLLVFIIPLIGFLYWMKRRNPDETTAEHPQTLATGAAIIWFLVGMILLILSAKTLVSGAESLALHFGVSPLIVGLTVVAVGTSLPELAASLVSAIRGNHDIALGNVIGSNIFNLLAVMSIPAILGGQVLDEQVFSRDYLTMLILTLALSLTIYFVMLLQRRAYKQQLGRWIGMLLLLSYFAYTLLLAGTAFQ